MCIDAVGVLALPWFCSGHPVGVLPCSAVRSGGPAGAPWRRGGRLVASILGLERGTHEVESSGVGWSVVKWNGTPAF